MHRMLFQTIGQKGVVLFLFFSFQLQSIKILHLKSQLKDVYISTLHTTHSNFSYLSLYNLQDFTQFVLSYVSRSDSYKKSDFW